MYKRILVPTDGSPLARKGIKTGLELAKAVGASVIGYHAVEPIERIWYIEGVGIRPKEVEAARRSLWALGERYLEVLRKEAAAAGVKCDTLITDPADPFQGIIDAAKAKKCDVICMASHGRGAIASAMLGNVTHKVLTHSKIPVLVCR
jgi:nucleotide-binding universal stress UspA family protein